MSKLALKPFLPSGGNTAAASRYADVGRSMERIKSNIDKVIERDVTKINRRRAASNSKIGSVTAVAQSLKLCENSSGATVWYNNSHAIILKAHVPPRANFDAITEETASTS